MSCGTDLPGYAIDSFCESEVGLLPLLCAYSALVPTKHLSIPSSLQFNEAHDFLLEKILLNHHLKNYPPSSLYQQSFWKWALDQLECLCRDDEDSEIDEHMYAHYLGLMSSVRSDEPPPNSYKTHYWRPSQESACVSEAESFETITLLESRTTIEAGTTGLRTWRASLILAHYLIEHAELVAHSTVLELGSGTGFIGILVASLQLHAGAVPSTSKTSGAANSPSIILTDVNSAVLTRCQNNIQLPCNRSASHPRIGYRSLDWFDSLSCRESLSSLLNEASADIILGADIVFDPDLIPPLVATLSLALSSERTKFALIALTVRNEESLTYFLDEIRKVLKIEDVDYTLSSNLPLLTLDEVDAGLQVKIFKIIQPR
ncbi:hypothetical protein HYDPIDRAFT_109408 [Hydnomerulius pinastri MD-312]|nr:hypothetical protein HYDPIDRAFT_109408 [Hydnomerulius pinastri MD-312]